MSFQATEWARGLPLHTISAKFTLMMIGSYAGTDGACFPSLTTLAEDTLQSVQTVRRRIRELEQLGLLVRFSRWTSPDGAVVLTQSGEGDRPVGHRQSSDEIRLQLQVRPEQLLARIDALDLGRKDAADQDDSVTTEGEGEGINLAPSPPITVESPAPSHSSDSPRVSPGSNPLKRLSNSSGETPPKWPPRAGGRMKPIPG